MRLYILRHGKAKNSLPDELRELETEGREDLKFVLNQRLDELRTVKKIQCSPLVRAKQTAKIAQEQILFNQDVSENIHLTPWAKPMDFIRSIDEEKGNLLVASHQPFVSELVAVLTGEKLWMPTASLVCIEAEYMAPQTASFIWQQNPQEI